MKVFENIKTWKNVTKPNNTIWFFQFVFSVIPSICFVLTSIPNAKFVTCIINRSYDEAKHYLLLSFILSMIYAISWHIQYLLDNKQLCHVYHKIQKQIFDKIFIADDSNFHLNSKAKMINIISNNITELSDFCDYSAIKFACFFEFVILICIIFSNNIIVGLFMTAVAFLVFLVLKTTNFLIAKTNLKLFHDRDNLSEHFSNIVDNRIISQDFNLKDSLEKTYFEKVYSITKNYKSRTILKSMKDNFVFVLHTLTTFLITLYLINLIKLDQITSTTLLVLVPYLSSTSEKIICFSNISADIENGAISAMRVKTLLSMSPKELIDFGNNSSSEISGAITFSHVSYSSENKQNKTLGKINPFFVQIFKNQIALFQGNKNCGKRAIFYMLRRAIRPDTGTITLDTINISDFSQNSFVHKISYATKKPFFFVGTIIQNFKLINPSKHKIFESCKKAKIHEKIASLPESYQTNLTINQNLFSEFEKFQLSLARAILFDSAIILIYEFPIGMTENETKKLQEIFKELKKTKTIIMFSAKNHFEQIIDRHFLIENNTLKEISKQTKVKKEKIIIDSKFSK